uniref:Uncharacterized protein n=1 Tax=Sarcophilus harrisii TaxID=9305 RepID=A0A7N4PLT1_SARHA
MANLHEIRKMLEIFRGLHDDLRGRGPHKLLGTGRTEEKKKGAALCAPLFSRPHDGQLRSSQGLCHRE